MQGVLKIRIVTFKLPDSLLEELDMYALKHGISRSDAIRLAIKNLISQRYTRPRYRVKRIVLT